MEPLNVLIVDDDQAIRDILAELFHIEGFAPQAVPSLEAGRLALAEGAFDLVLADSFGRTLDEAALAPLRALVAAAAPTPVILMTAHAEAARIGAGEHELAGVVLKPFDFDELLELIRTLKPL